MTHEEQIERALDAVMEVVEDAAPRGSVDEHRLRLVLDGIIARAGAEAREAESERRGVENFDGPGRW